MNNFQNYIADKPVIPSKIVTDFSEKSEEEQRIENHEKKNQENFDKHKPSGAFKIFYESNLNATDSRVEKNFKSVKKKRCRDSAIRVTTEDKKRIRKNSKKPQPETVTEKRINKSNNISVLRSQLGNPNAEKSVEEPERRENKLNQHLFNKNELISTPDFGETFFSKLESHKTTPINVYPKPTVITEKKSITGAKPKEGFLAHSNLPQKHTEKPANKPSIKPAISDIGKRRINEILKGHAQKIIKEKISQTKNETEIIKEEPNPVDLAENIESKDTEPLPNSEVKNEIQENPKLEEKNSKIVGKESKESKKGKEDSKANEVGLEDKKKLPSTWVNLPQSNELERRLKSFGQETHLFLNHKGQKTDGQEQTKAEEEKKQKVPEDNQKGKQRPISVDDSQKGKKKPNAEDNQKEDGKKSDKRETYTDRLLLLKMIGKDLEDKRKAIEINEEEQRIANFEKVPHETKKTPNPKVAVNVIKPSFSKELVLHEKRDLSPMRVEKLFETETIHKTKQTRSAELRDLVSQAIKEHKIFCIFDNHTYIVRPVREELLNRGWLEIIPDRRLIPRRRPPPMGPVFDRAPDKATVERNCNTLEAILTARQAFTDELQDTVSRSPSFKYTIEKPKIIATAVNLPKKKISQESVHEVKSHFCIIPPNCEQRKTNVDIREFVAKYNAILERGKERENDLKKLKEREKNAKNQKKEKSNPPSEKGKSEEQVKTPVPVVQPPLSTKKSIQKIADSIKDNNKMLISVVTEIGHLGEKAGNSPLGVLYDTSKKTLASIKNTGASENEKQEVPAQTNTYKNSFTESEARTISKIIQSANARIHFMWLSIKPGIHLKCFNYSPEIINKFQRTTFCTKIGLWSHLSNLQWYAHEVNFPAKSPRMYNTGEADDLQAFFQDFQMTACIGMLKWISDTFFEKGLKGIHAKKGKVPLKAFEFAIRQCEKYMRFKENEDLTAFEDIKVLEDEWNTFLQWFYSITNDHGKVQESSTAQLMVVYTRAAETLKLMRRYWPEIDIDGRLNIWIMKPYCASCGRGIFMTNNVYYIGQHSKYIVQKYIEKPLLIYNTKFDIRQWFLITKLTPLEIWMYKWKLVKFSPILSKGYCTIIFVSRECYLRFCTQPFVLRNLHESVHLSNNSVQRKYISSRDPSLPDQNMWDSKTFQLYLRTIGQPSVWEDVIYPGMRDAIVSTMLSAQDTFDGPRKSWFEVYGADFMLSSNLKDGPWLIEINENPAMDPSTKVTARLCPQMLRDVIKVVVDKRSNKNANTGQWELVYRQNYSPSYGIVNLDIKGKKIARNPYNKINSETIYTKPAPNERKPSDEVASNKLYEFVNSFRGNQNSGLNSTYFENFKNRKRVLQIKKMNESEQSAKTSSLLKKFEKQATDENWKFIEVKNCKPCDDKEAD